MTEYEVAIKKLVTEGVREARGSKSKDDKDFVHLAGEYFTAAELHRRQVHATITYGNAKSADVLAFSLDGERFARVEVKSSRADKGGHLVWTGTLDRFVDKVNQFWVLCLLPNVGDEATSPRFFVLTAAEMRSEVSNRIDAYVEKRGGLGDATKWMWTMTINELRGTSYEGAWDKIVEFLRD